MIQHYRMFAAYNRWANRCLYDAAESLDEAAYRADRGAFFGSLHGMLNHILVGDRIWMRRFTGEGPTYTKLDAVPCDDLESLRREQETEDERIVAWVDSLDGDTLMGTFSYRTVINTQDVTQPLAPALAHFFNHQAHHRGQAHCLLTEAGGPDAAPPLDLLYFQRETGVGLN